MKSHAPNSKSSAGDPTLGIFGLNTAREFGAGSSVMLKAQSRWCIMSCALLVTAVTALAQVTNQPSATPPLPELGFSVLRLLGALVLVLALFFAGIWGFKHWQRLALHKGRVPQLNILEVKSLGSRHALYLVAYEQQRLLLASSPAGLSLVTHLPEAGADDVAVPAPTFVQVLHRALAPKA